MLCSFQLNNDSSQSRPSSLCANLFRLYLGFCVFRFSSSCMQLDEDCFEGLRVCVDLSSFYCAWMSSVCRRRGLFEWFYVRVCVYCALLSCNISTLFSYLQLYRAVLGLWCGLWFVLLFTTCQISTPFSCLQLDKGCSGALTCVKICVTFFFLSCSEAFFFSCTSDFFLTCCNALFLSCSIALFLSWSDDVLLFAVGWGLLLGNAAGEIIFKLLVLYRLVCAVPYIVCSIYILGGAEGQIVCKVLRHSWW